MNRRQILRIVGGGFITAATVTTLTGCGSSMPAEAIAAWCAFGSLLEHQLGLGETALRQAQLEGLAMLGARREVEREHLLGHALEADLHALHEQLNEAGLLGGEELVPHGIEGEEGLADLVLAHLAALLLRCPPGADDDLGLQDNRAELVDDRGLNL